MQRFLRGSIIYIFFLNSQNSLFALDEKETCRKLLFQIRDLSQQILPAEMRGFVSVWINRQVDRLAESGPKTNGFLIKHPYLRHFLKQSEQRVRASLATIHSVQLMHMKATDPDFAENASSSSPGFFLSVEDSEKIADFAASILGEILTFQ